jgi:2-oxoglutarate dehydrogenase E1 component
MTFDEILLACTTNVQVAEEMYEQYRFNPDAVDKQWREFFEECDTLSYESLTPSPDEKDAKAYNKEARDLPLESGEEASPILHEVEIHSDIRIFNLIHAYREYGYSAAQVNPIETRDPEPSQLSLHSLGFSEDELPYHFPTCGFLREERATLADIISVLKEIYCRDVGVEYMDMGNPELEAWLQQQVEPTRFAVSLTIEQKQMIFQQLNKSELFESFLHTKYAGQKRFSLEGSETLIPILMSIIEYGSEKGVVECVIGMAHRGRLNVLSNILNKSYGDIFSEFEENYIPNTFEGSGDVKYHKGYSSRIKTEKGKELQVILVDNPSHLESVNTVVEGVTKALQEKSKKNDAESMYLPILIHGDASIAGQGVVYETLQLQKLKGYSTGGTIHIVVNNHIGFTTLSKESRSTSSCTDISRAFSAPVFHVNAEKPESCIYAMNLALDIRQRFHCDVFINLNCYRKYGHNESDEPAYTQPVEYTMIRQKTPIREMYRDHLIHSGVLEKYMAEVLEKEFKAALKSALTGVRSPKGEGDSALLLPPDGSVAAQAFIFKPVKTGVQGKTLKAIAERFCRIPEKFNIHKKLGKIVEKRRAMVSGDIKKKTIDWGMAEHLAYGSLLVQGHDVRISGQDSCRGTFSHRHAVWFDQLDARRYVPLKRLKKEQGNFEICNSPLSEFGVLGFEYGYSTVPPKALVIWEAQFGDFANGAQVIIDQYISSAEQKWGKRSHLVMLLPHGYEGQGPEHSSARIERYLQLVGDHNMFVVNPSTPAQLFHLLRRHVLADYEKPLVIFTPKGLLRHPRCLSSVKECVSGHFYEILDDEMPTDEVTRLVLCSGRIYYDLVAERDKRDVENIAIVRIEQLYPLHAEYLKKIISRYTGLVECFWVQEEPSNMGAWSYIAPRLKALISDHVKIRYVGRQQSASPAVGAYSVHQKEYTKLINNVFIKSQQQLFEMSYESLNA